MAALALTATVAAAADAEKPQKSQLPRQPTDVRCLGDVEYAKANGTTLLLDVAMSKELPAKPRPAIVYIHGGGWEGGSKEAGLGWAYRFAQAGYIGVTINYRLTDQAPFPAQIQDCKCAIRFLRSHAVEYRIDPDRIGVMGDSAGGHLVALLGLTEGVAAFDGDSDWPGVSSRVQAVCDWFGPTDFVAWASDPDPGIAKNGNSRGIVRLLGATPLQDQKKAAWASPMSYVEQSQHTPPFFIAHGDRDTLVPMQQSIALADALERKGVEVIFRLNLNRGHGGGNFGPPLVPEIMAFFHKHLDAVAPAASSE